MKMIGLDMSHNIMVCKLLSHCHTKIFDIHLRSARVLQFVNAWRNLLTKKIKHIFWFIIIIESDKHRISQSSDGHCFKTRRKSMCHQSLEMEFSGEFCVSVTQLVCLSDMFNPWLLNPQPLRIASRNLDTRILSYILFVFVIKPLKV